MNRPLALALTAMLSLRVALAHATDQVIVGHAAELPWSSFIRVVSGVEAAPPNDAHPEGTVYVGHTDRRTGAQITEWDLARASSIRTVALHQHPKYSDVSLTRDERAVVAVLGGYEQKPLELVVMDSALAVRHRYWLPVGRGANVVLHGATAAVTYYAERRTGQLEFDLVFVDTETGARSAALALTLSADAQASFGFRESNTVGLADGRVVVLPARGAELYEVEGATRGVPRVVATASAAKGGELAAAPGGFFVSSFDHAVLYSASLSPLGEIGVDRHERLAVDAATGSLVTDRGTFIAGADRAQVNFNAGYNVPVDLFWAHGRGVLLKICEECGAANVAWFDPRGDRRSPLGFAAMPRSVGSWR